MGAPLLPLALLEVGGSWVVLLCVAAGAWLLGVRVRWLLLLLVGWIAGWAVLSAVVRATIINDRRYALEREAHKELDGLAEQLHNHTALGWCAYHL